MIRFTLHMLFQVLNWIKKVDQKSYPLFKNIRSDYGKKGIVLIYNDINNRVGASCDSVNLNHMFQRLPEFRDR